MQVSLGQISWKEKCKKVVIRKALKETDDDDDDG